jgi:hypothetical protein
VNEESCIRTAGMAFMHAVAPVGRTDTTFFIVQTFDPVTLAHFHAKSVPRLPERLLPFDFTKPEDTALFVLLIRLKRFMQDAAANSTVKARVFIDEGYKKNGKAIRIPTFESAFADGLVCFANYSSILPIQLADFAAFALNRSQLIGGKEQRSSLDNRLLEILSPIAWNYQNIEKSVISLADGGAIIKTREAQGEGHS